MLLFLTLALASDDNAAKPEQSQIDAIKQKTRQAFALIQEKKWADAATLLQQCLPPPVGINTDPLVQPAANILEFDRYFTKARNSECELTFF